MNARITGALLVATLVVAHGCGASDAGPRCIEGLCLALPPGSTVTGAVHQHTIRLPGVPGWIDIQTFQPGAAMPATLDDAARMLARRYELEGDASVNRVARGAMGTREAALVDVTVRRPSSQVRRVVLLASAGDQRWIAVDATGPIDQFPALQREFESRLRRATWSTR